ncbi:MAG: prepilin-type N-terminal cleavage/methylation domain-containing protein [Phycisphaerales bacterium]|nr:prepilin-type N-terminal cleavage/methylation domain-containing protein [Phycisphaerales bacterium]
MRRSTACAERACSGNSVRGRMARGFTLVELLVVISIIALLISILLPSLRRAREQAKSLKCLAHARGLAQAGATFANDHNDRFQLVTSDQGNTEADESKSKYAYDNDGELMGWIVALAQVTSKSSYNHNWEWGVRAGNYDEAVARKALMNEDFELAMCPSDKVRISTPFYPNGPQLLGQGNPQNPSPAGTGLYWGYLSYGINEDLTGAQDGFSPLPPVGRYDPAVPMAWRTGQRSPFAGQRLEGQLERAHDPATVLLITDAGADSEQEASTADATGSNSRADGVVNLIISAQASGPLLAHSQDKWPQRIPTKRHLGGAVNVVFADFHGETVTPTGWRKSSADPRMESPKGHNATTRISPYKITGTVRELN